MENKIKITILSPVGVYRHHYNTKCINILASNYDVELVEVIGMSDVYSC